MPSLKHQKADRIEMQKVYGELCRISPNVAFEPSFFTLPHTRINNQTVLLRSDFAALAYWCVKSESRIKHPINKYDAVTTLPLVSEVLMDVFYYDNQIFDKKGGVISFEQICENINIRNQLLSLLQLLVGARIKNRQIKEAVQNFIIETNLVLAEGQRMEQNSNHYAQWKNTPQYKSNKIKLLDDNETKWAIGHIAKIIIQSEVRLKDKTAFLHQYLQRIYLTNAFFFRKIVELLLQGTEMPQDTRINLIRFANLFGLMLQIVNDNIDFAPTEEGHFTQEKNCCDALSDLKNGNITLPIMIHLARCPDGKIQQFLKREITYDENAFVEEIINSHSIFASMTIGKAIKAVIKSCLPDNNAAKAIIQELLSVADNNKYYKFFYKQEQYRTYKKQKKQ